ESPACDATVSWARSPRTCSTSRTWTFRFPCPRPPSLERRLHFAASLATAFGSRYFLRSAPPKYEGRPQWLLERWWGTSAPMALPLASPVLEEEEVLSLRRSEAAP